MYHGPTTTKFGQVAVAEPLRFDLIEFHHESTLKEVDHVIPIPVLDQEDFGKQGIDVTKLVQGAQATDALGSCTCNSGTAHIAERWATAGKDITGLSLTGASGSISLSATDAIDDEKFAIVLYHLVTDQTGDPAQEWPPTDCGSNGLYVCQELIKLGYASSYKAASSVTGAITLLQGGTVMQGGPWFNSWMRPDSNGFVDGDGSIDALQAAIQSGVAGGPRDSPARHPADRPGQQRLSRAAEHRDQGQELLEHGVRRGRRLPAARIHAQLPRQALRPTRTAII